MMEQTLRHAGAPVTVTARAGIDCAITAAHQLELIQVRDDGTTDVKRMSIESSAAGMDQLRGVLADTGVSVDVVIEPTSMTWVGIQAAIAAAGSRLFMIGTKHSARLRAAVAGKNKSDVIDAHVLAMAADIFDLRPFPVAAAGTEVIKRSALARGHARKDLDRAWRRLRSYMGATVPDIDKILGRSRNQMLAVLRRWPDIRALARAQHPTIVATLHKCSYRHSDHDDIATRLRQAAGDWGRILTGYYDLDFFATKIDDLVKDIDTATVRLADHTSKLIDVWHHYYGADELLLSLPGIGPITAATIRGWLGDGTRFACPKAFASYCGLVPSN